MTEPNGWVDGAIREFCEQTSRGALRAELLLPRGFEKDPETGLRYGTNHHKVEVWEKFDLDRPGKCDQYVYNLANGCGPVITVRDFDDDQVLLHEILHAVLGAPGATEDDPEGHAIIGMVEVALWDAGYRRNGRAANASANRDDCSPEVLARNQVRTNPYRGSEWKWLSCCEQQAIDGHLPTCPRVVTPPEGSAS